MRFSRVSTQTHRVVTDSDISKTPTHTFHPNTRNTFTHPTPLKLEEREGGCKRGREGAREGRREGTREGRGKEQEREGGKPQERGDLNMVKATAAESKQLTGCIYPSFTGLTPIFINYKWP